jgi:hypothetical protein
VFDNVDDAKIISPYLPTAGNGSILITARNTSPSFTTAQKTLVVEPMTLEESSSMLLGQLAYDEKWATATAEEEEAARALCAELGGLPLAIAQIAGFVLNGGGDLVEVLDLFETRDTGVFFEGQQEPVDSYYEHTLSTVWDVTLIKLDEPTLTFLDIVAFMDPDSITEELFQFPQQVVLDNPELSQLRGMGR